MKNLDHLMKSIKNFFLGEHSPDNSNNIYNADEITKPINKESVTCDTSALENSGFQKCDYKKISSSLVYLDYSISLMPLDVFISVPKDQFDFANDNSKTVRAKLTSFTIGNFHLFKRPIKEDLIFKNPDTSHLDSIIEDFYFLTTYIMFDIFFEISLSKKNKILSTKKTYLPISPHIYKCDKVKDPTLDDFKLNINLKDIFLNPMQQTPTSMIYKVVSNINIELSPLIKIDPINASTLIQFNNILKKELSNNIFTNSELLLIEELRYKETTLFTSDFFKYLKNLKKLNLIKCNFYDIEKDLLYLENLEEINLSNNGLIVLPDMFKECKNLKIIKLNNNSICDLSDFKDKDIVVWCINQKINYDIFKKNDLRFEIDTCFLCDEKGDTPSIKNISNHGYIELKNNTSKVIFDINCAGKTVSFEFSNSKNFTGKVYTKLI